VVAFAARRPAHDLAVHQHAQPDLFAVVAPANQKGQVKNVCPNW